jgi:hypothetical protein
MPGENRDEVTGQTGVPRSCCGRGPARPINQSGGHAQMSSGLEAQTGFQREAGYTHASVSVPQQFTTVLPSRAGPYTNHRTLVHADCGGPTRAGSEAEPECPNLVWTDLVHRTHKFLAGLDCQRTSSIGPPERFGHGRIKIVNKGHNMGAELLHECETGAFEESSQCCTQSSSVRVEPLEGAMIWPEATSKFAING